jgi:hypothetical protein
MSLRFHFPQNAGLTPREHQIVHALAAMHVSMASGSHVRRGATREDAERAAAEETTEFMRQWFSDLDIRIEWQP